MEGVWEGGWGGGRKGVKPVYLREESDSRLPANNPPRLSAFSPRLPEPLPLKFLSFTPCFFSFSARSARQLLQIYCNSPSSLCFSSPPSQNMLKKKRQEKQKPPPSSFLLLKPAAPLKRSLVTPLFRGDISKKAKHPSFRAKKREKKRITEEKKPVSRWMARVPACLRARAVVRQRAWASCLNLGASLGIPPFIPRWRLTAALSVRFPHRSLARTGTNCVSAVTRDGCEA